MYNTYLHITDATNNNSERSRWHDSVDKSLMVSKPSQYIWGPFGDPHDVILDNGRVNVPFRFSILVCPWFSAISEKYTPLWIATSKLQICIPYSKHTHDLIFINLVIQIVYICLAVNPHIVIRHACRFGLSLVSQTNYRRDAVHCIRTATAKNATTTLYGTAK